MVQTSRFDIATSFQNAVNTFFTYIPNIIGFLVILVVGYIIARLVRTLVNKALGKLKVDQSLDRTSAGKWVDKVSPGGKPSRLIGAVCFWIIFLYALTAAIGALKIPAVTSFMNQVLSYLPNVIAAILIFVIAAVLAGVVVEAVKKTMGDTPTGKLVEAVVPGLIMAIAVFMILNQLHIAPAIVQITYTALIGMLALAGALAFGLGGRDVAAQIWSSAYANNQKVAKQAQQDVQTGKARAQDGTGTSSTGQHSASQPQDQQAGHDGTGAYLPGASTTSYESPTGRGATRG